MVMLEKVTVSLDEWQLSIEGFVNDMKLDLSKTKIEVSKISCNWERTILGQPATMPRIFTAAPATIEHPLGNAPTTVPSRHYMDNHHRESGFGVVSILIHSLVKGMPPLPIPPTLRSVLPPIDDHGVHSGTIGVGHNGFHSPKLPKFYFPKFDGS